MTGQLRSTLQTRADQLDAWEVDLDAVVRQGDRRVRRRRTSVAGGLAGALVVVGGLAVFAGHTHRTTPQPADDNAKPLSYAVGSVIHSGSTTIDVGHRVVSMVQSAHGFVFSSPDLGVFAEQDGKVKRIGRLADGRQRLLTGDDGLVTTWFDGRYLRAWPLTFGVGVHNTLENEPSWPKGDPPQVSAISGGQAWFWDGRRMRVEQVAPSPGSAEWVDHGLPDSDTVQGAGGGRLLVRVGDGLAVVPDNKMPLTLAGLKHWHNNSHLPARPQVSGIASGTLAPDGKHWFSGDRGQFRVYDSATGAAQTFDHPGGYPSATPYQWLGDDTIAAAAVYPPTDGAALQPVELLVCHVSTSTCTVAAKATAGNLVLGDGSPTLPFVP